MNDTLPPLRRDLEFFPIQHGGQQLILIRDHLGLVQEGKAVPVPIYRIMAQLDGTSTIRDLQMDLMRQRGGVLVGTDEVKDLLSSLDESFFLDSERFRTARDRIVEDFASKRVRACSHCGIAYPENPLELRNRLDEILSSQPNDRLQEEKIVGLVSPHIDLSVGYKVYSSAYGILKKAPSRIMLLGVGHHVVDNLFSLTDKDFETPLGVVKNDTAAVRKLREAGRDIIAPNDFAHRSEHSIEFQVIFFQHLFPEENLTIIPILCGFIQSNLPEYDRKTYLEMTKPFREQLKEIIMEPDEETLLLAGVDFSHIGPKFGHEMPAEYLKNQSETHDKNLLKYLSILDADHFWQESRDVKDQFNVCGFSALACMLEVLPPCTGKILNYQFWHEEATRSAVSFSAVVFTS